MATTEQAQDTQPGSDAEAVRTVVNERGIEFLFAQFVDMHGKPSAKLVPAHHLDDLLTDGAGFAGFAAGDIGQGPHDPDMIAIPDPPASRPAVEARPSPASPATCTVEGEPWPYCPRTILRNALERAKALGFELKIGAELEYFLLRRTRGRRDRARRPARHARPALLRHARADAQPRLRLESSRQAVTELGWDNYATDHEDANGQFEQNFQYDNALTTCDRAVFFRYMVESLAQERGLLATFMPKPFANLTGNGCHFHFSLWQRRRERRSTCDPSDDPRGLGLSPLAYNFIGGLKAHAKAYIAVTAPTVNSYKRLVVGAPTSGADLGAGLHQLRLQQPHPDAPDPRRRPDRGPHRRRLVQPVPGRDRDARRRPRRDRARARRRASPTRPTCTSCPTRSARHRGSSCCPANLLDATRELERDDVLRKALGKTRRRRLHRLLRPGQARGVAGGARADHAVGAGPLPAAVLSRFPTYDLHLNRPEASAAAEPLAGASERPDGLRARTPRAGSRAR